MSRAAGGMLQGRRLLVFDLDGTLADTTPLHAAAFEQVLGTSGIPVHYPSIAGMKTVEAIRKCFDDAGRRATESEVRSLTRAKQQLVRDLIREKLHPLPGVNKFLAWARPRYRLGIGTSGSRDTVELALATLEFAGMFNPVVCAEDAAKGKPAPDIFLRVLQMTGVRPEEALVFEDSEAGFAAARAAKLDYIDVTTFTWSV